MVVRKIEPQDLGSYLKSLRLARNLTLRDVEKKAGISISFLSQMESGKVKKPSQVTLYKLAQEFCVLYEDLMERAGHPVSINTKTKPVEQEISSRFGTLTEDEEESLAEYLSFLRSRSAKSRGKK